MEDVTVGRPATSAQLRGDGVSPIDGSQDLPSVPPNATDIAQDVRHQRAALCDIMVTCGYLL